VAPAEAATIHAALGGGPRGLAVKITDEQRLPLGPAGATASAPAQPGRTYLLVVRDPGGKSSSTSDAYTLTISF
jgi:hypothetical protein